MTVNRDFDDIARAWLDLMPDEVPDRVVDSVLLAVDATPQVRPWFARPWRISKMSRLALVGSAAVLVVVAAGTLALFPRPREDVGNPPTASPPSSSGAPTSSTSGGPLDDALRAKWIAVANSNATLGNGAGPVSMTVTSAGTGIGAANFGPGYAYPSTATQVAADQIELTLERDGGDCSAGARGVYRWALSDDRSQLALTSLSEDCQKRGIVFARRWARSLEGATTVGAGVVDTMEPHFAITLPDDTFQARTLDDFIEIGGTDGFSLMAFKNPQPFVDACSTDEERVPYQPGAAAFVEAFRNNDAFEVGPSTDLTIDGHDALYVRIAGTADYARCPGQPLYQYTPKDCLCHFIVGQGDADRMYLVEVGSDTFMFILSPIGITTDELAIIETIRIPFQLPTQ